MKMHTCPSRTWSSRFLVALAALSMVATGCADSATVAEPTATEPTTTEEPSTTPPTEKEPPSKAELEIFGGSSAFMPLWIADEQGLLAEQGLTMHYSQVLQGAAIIEALSGNHADAASTTFVSMISAASAAPGPKLVMASSLGFPVSLYLQPDVASEYGLTETGPFSDLAALKGSGIRIGAGPLGGALDVWLKAIAADADLTAGPEESNDIVTIPSDAGPPQIALWNQNDVDGLFVPDEFVAASSLTDYVSLPVGSTAPVFNGIGGTGLAVSEAMLNDHPDSVQALVNAAYEAIQWAADPANKDGVLDLFQSNLSMSADGAALFYDKYITSITTGADICMTDAQFDGALNLANIGRDEPISVPIEDVIDQSFCEAAAAGEG